MAVQNNNPLDATSQLSKQRHIAAKIGADGADVLEPGAPVQGDPSSAPINVGDTWGDNSVQNPQQRVKQPPMPATSGPVKAPTHYEAAPAMDQIVSGEASLELGHKGPPVMMLQQALNKLGADPKLAEDGMLGPKTYEALKAFQEKNGVPAGEVGSVGPNTLHAFSQQLSSEDIDRMRDRAVASYAISNGQVDSVGRKPRGSVTDSDIDRALGQQEWTAEMQANVGNFKPISMSDSNAQLGTGDRTIRQSGCMLTAFAMASTGLTGNTSLTAASANEIVRRGNGFDGSSLRGDKAATALGMRELDRTGTHRTSLGNMRNQIDSALASGQAVVLGVDYKEGSRGTGNGTGVDHWITITGKDASGNYTAIDPVGGRTLTMTAAADGSLRGRGWASGTQYVGKEAIFLARA